MRRGRLLWHLLPTYLLVTLASLLVVTLYASGSVRGSFREQLRQDLESQANILALWVREALLAGDIGHVERLCTEFGSLSPTRLTVILPSGEVAGDSYQDPSMMENHGSRPEVLDAIGAAQGTVERYSNSVHRRMLYVAVPLLHEGELIGVARASMPSTLIEQTLRSIYLRSAAVGLLVALLAGLVSFEVSRRITRPLEGLRQGADRFARGDFATRLILPDSLEMAGLADAMNHMAAQLDQRIRNEVQQRGEQEALFASMVEGVIAIDTDERILSINAAAGGFFGIDAGAAAGRNLREVIRNPGLHQFVEDAVAQRSPVHGEIVVSERDGQVLQATGTTLHDAQDNAKGVVVVVNDVTPLRRLERVRSDFVANVSHELRTPITAIKGFVETLLDGAINNPERAEHFLSIIAKQADRLNAIIEDLLMLSRVEQDADREDIRRESCDLAAILRSAVQHCGAAASAREIALELHCPSPVPVRVNPQLIEQAVVNLIDNAVKYSDPRSTVAISGGRDAAVTRVDVQDSGCGIPGEHLPRLFERFYRVDKARSRSMGGTGLGLAIVKHIVQAHGGKVTVQSQPGEGSTFSLHIPDKAVPATPAQPGQGNGHPASRAASF
jgi:two-component system, OmpR family, phosphate regulon sensor histidine kinase PhoR